MLDIFHIMALVNRDGQLSVSAAQQSTRESKRKRDVKVLDEETYVQVSLHKALTDHLKYNHVVCKKKKNKAHE